MSKREMMKSLEERRRKVRRPRNVFVDLGFSREEAASLAMKAKLLSQIVRYAKQYSQSELSKMLDEPQPRISDLMRGKSSKFSLETLVNYAAALDMRPEIHTRRPVTSLTAAEA